MSPYPTVRKLTALKYSASSSVVGLLGSLRVNIVGSESSMGTSVIEAHIPLANMFGYSTELRSNSQGKAEYTMEFERYEAVPRHIQDELIRKYADNKKG